MMQISTESLLDFFDHLHLFGAFPLAILLLVVHFYRRKRPLDVLDFVLKAGLSLFAIVFVIGVFMVFHENRQTIHFRDIVTAVMLCAVVVFVSVSELLLAGMAETLTRWRGKKWVKEMDYVYLSMAGIGLLASINRLSTLSESDRIGVPDFYGPMLVSAALAIRAIKTRAEIGNWNEPVVAAPQ